MKRKLFTFHWNCLYFKNYTSCLEESYTFFRIMHFIERQNILFYPLTQKSSESTILQKFLLCSHQSRRQFVFQKALVNIMHRILYPPPPPTSTPIPHPPGRWGHNFIRPCRVVSRDFLGTPILKW